MEQHPVPQNITSYEFRLVGDMTLKQFFQLAGGVLVGIIIYRLPLIGLLKYPLVFIAVVIGVVMAFVPINGRPFTQWILAFFHAIYSPTEFIWRPAIEDVPITSQATATAPVAPSIFLNFSSFLHKKTAPVATTPATPSSPPPPSPPKNTPPPEKPNPSPTISVSSITPPPPTIPPVTQPTSTAYTSLKTSSPASNNPSSVSTPTPSTSSTPPPSSPSTLKPPPPTKAPPTPPTSTPSTAPPAHIFDSASLPPTPQKETLPPSISTTLTEPQTARPLPPSPTATAAPNIDTPTIPNVLSGVINTPENTPLEGVTVEIIDSNTGIPARALRTNRLGQFQIAIPLPRGNYVISAEKDNYFFDPVSVKVTGQIIHPIVISSKAA